MMATNKPMLNLACGKVTLPCARPAHHALVDADIYEYPHWHNVDRRKVPGAEGIDEVVNVMRYPWPWADNSYSGALLGHMIEHVPHDIHLSRVNHNDPEWWESRREELEGLENGWYAFLSELARVLTPGSVAHILSPYAWSNGAFTDPTHRRYITEHTFTHGFNEDDPYHQYAVGCKWELVEPPSYDTTPMFERLPLNEDLRRMAFQTQINQVYNIYGKIRVVKDE